MKQYHIYGLGAALVDTEISVTDHDLIEQTIDKGVMTLVDDERQRKLIQAFSNNLMASKRASGGSCANSIIAASELGAECFYACKVANDDNGQFFLDDMRAAGVDLMPTNGSAPGTTGKCLVMITPDAERTMNTYLGISEQVSTQDIDFDALKQADLVYIEGYLVTSDTGRAAAIALKQAADEQNLRTAFSLSDPAMVQFFGDGLKEMIGHGVDTLFCNQDEALAFTHTQSIDDAFNALSALANTVVMTRGAEGACILHENNITTIEAMKVQAIDTNGAGDMFAGAWLFARSQGYSILDSGQLAARASALVVSQYGPRLRADQFAQLKERQVVAEEV